MSKYYKKIFTDNSGFEESYWSTIVDPDGNVRNRLEEEQKVIANVRKEIDFINALPPSKVFDVGCGLGFLLGALDEKHEKFGLEVSQFASDYAKKYAQIYNSTIEDADLKENSFDVIISNHVIEHVDSPEIFLNKLKTILRKDGILILATPDFENVCAKLFKENYRMLYDKTHTNLFSFKSLKSMLIDFGFEILEVDFPFFDTEYFNEKNILKMLDYDKNETSPACWGNFMTFYCKNKK